MSQVAIICIFDIDTTSTSPEALAELVTEALVEDGLPLKSANPWGRESGTSNLAGVASALGTLNPNAPPNGQQV